MSSENCEDDRTSRRTKQRPNQCACQERGQPRSHDQLRVELPKS